MREEVEGYTVEEMRERLEKAQETKSYFIYGHKTIAELTDEEVKSKHADMMNWFADAGRD